MRHTFTRARRWLGTGLTLGLFVVLTGCGAKGTVTGKVIYKDKAGKETELTQGSVTFLTEDNHTISGKITEEGYRVEGCPTGRVRIGISAAGASGIPSKGKNMGGGYGDAGPKGMNMTDEIKEKMGGRLDPAGGKNAGVPDKVLAEYKVPDKSGLTYEVTSGSQEYTIVLTDKAPSKK
jgi:hypothetical protein